MRMDTKVTTKIYASFNGSLNGHLPYVQSLKTNHLKKNLSCTNIYIYNHFKFPELSTCASTHFTARKHPKGSLP